MARLIAKSCLRALAVKGVVVEDVMIPRQEVVGIDLSDDWSLILKQLANSRHMVLPLYDENIDQIKGVVNLRKVLNAALHLNLDKKTLIELAEPIYFIPESTPITTQLVHFQQRRRRIGMVVDEYGEIMGLVSIEDILEEIVGEFVDEEAVPEFSSIEESSGVWLVDGGMPVRDFNRLSGAFLSTDGPNTLSGLLIESLEDIPDGLCCICFGGLLWEVIELQDKTIEKVRVQSNAVGHYYQFS